MKILLSHNTDFTGSQKVSIDKAQLGIAWLEGIFKAYIIKFSFFKTFF